MSTELDQLRTDLEMLTSNYNAFTREVRNALGPVLDAQVIAAANSAVIRDIRLTQLDHAAILNNHSTILNGLRGIADDMSIVQAEHTTALNEILRILRNK